MPARVSVSAALIVRDEAAFLGGCLASLAQAVDEVVIVDTGSTDETREIAKASGALVLERSWNRDFAEARNHALAAASSSWILYIDADERLVLPDCGRLSDYIDPAACAALVRFRPRTGFTRYWEWRLFRNDPRIRFRGRIHETPVPDILEVCQLDRLGIVQTPVKIDHLGYDGAQDHKHSRNLPILLDEIQNRPDRIYCRYHLAETLAALGRCEEAMQVAQAGLRIGLADGFEAQRADTSLLLQLLVRLRLEGGQDASALIEDGLRRFPDDYGLIFLGGRARLAQRSASEALEAAEALLCVDPDALTQGLAFDRTIFRERAHELAALALLQLGDRQAAARRFRLAGAHAADSRAYLLKAAALEAVPPSRCDAAIS